ncbi:hypothetical protein GCM10009744_51000 [Kribbella alba]|uniref:Uncharacterized protein n=1 Tax=Kribbella alba TaxID=190197 RepID=A0ABP4RJ39_9ACTN
MQPGWKPLTAGTGQSNGGVWLTPDGWVVKRLLPGVADPRHHADSERHLDGSGPGDSDGSGRLGAGAGAVCARSCGRASLGARQVLRDRLETVAGRGGWVALDRVDRLGPAWRHAVRNLWVRRDDVVIEAASDGGSFAE